MSRLNISIVENINWALCKLKAKSGNFYHVYYWFRTFVWYWGEYTYTLFISTNTKYQKWGFLWNLFPVGVKLIYRSIWKCPWVEYEKCLVYGNLPSHFDLYLLPKHQWFKKNGFSIHLLITKRILSKISMSHQ